MDGMMFYHATASGEELSALDDIVSLDFENNIKAGATERDNTFSVVLSEPCWADIPILNTDYLYIPGTDWGGIVTDIVHKTAQGTVTVNGMTWRGLLHQMVIEPPEGEAYLTFSNVDANQAIRLAVGNRYSSLISVTSDSAGVNVSGQWRYQTVAVGLNDLFEDNGLRLSIVWDNVSSKMILSAEPVDELTDEVELSQDYGVDFTSENGNQYIFNRCLALGKGELTERTVANVYYYNGSYYTSKPSGWDDDAERTIIYDYPNVESVDDLVKGAKDRLAGYLPKKSIKIDSANIMLDAGLGDIIGARDRLTGMVGQARVVRKILTIKNGTTSIEMGVE